MSCSGPSGCGVNNASQRPSSVRASARCAARKPSTRQVLPIPASPYTSAIRPSPAAASRSEPARLLSGASRSSSSIASKSPSVASTRAVAGSIIHRIKPTPIVNRPAGCLSGSGYRGSRAEAAGSGDRGRDATAHARAAATVGRLGRERDIEEYRRGMADHGAPRSLTAAAARCGSLIAGETQALCPTCLMFLPALWFSPRSAWGRRMLAFRTRAPQCNGRGSCRPGPPRHLRDRPRLRPGRDMAPPDGGSHHRSVAVRRWRPPSTSETRYRPSRPDA